ncbi:MAG: class I mannose-6-phosphate isomerase [Bacteroidales bacterium]
MISNYDKYPKIRLTNCSIWSGWESCMERILFDPILSGKPKKIIIFESYTGVLSQDIQRGISYLRPTFQWVANDWMKSEETILDLTRADVTDDQLFGFMTKLTINDFIDEIKVKRIREEISEIPSGTLVLFGTGASRVFPDPDLLVYLDMARWEIQKRMKQGKVNGLGVIDFRLDFSYQYKRGYFVDWRVCDNLKCGLLERIDYVIDTNQENSPRMLSGKDLLLGFREIVQQPFRVMPYFDPGPWGGQWMKNVCHLDPEEENYAWCFDCVPEENSLLFESDGVTFETPAINLVLSEPERLLGKRVFKQFGAEFPIRFDFLDTMEGGNLSFQVHPDPTYIRDNFGMQYTQDESYYLLDAKDDSCVYLGLKEQVDMDLMVSELERANLNGKPFDVERFVNRWPAKKHDHFLIPAGTVHCSGKNSMVLEISATPFIFTFKMWDWGRTGLDGKPRPINIGHAKKVINKKRDTGFAKRELINRFTLIDEGDGWKEERTGLHEEEFIETRRHWFTKPVLHDTKGTVNVLNLIEGTEAIVTSPSGSFSPFFVHYAETFIVPAGVGEYVISPTQKSAGKELATIKAFVRVGTINGPE